MHNAHPGAGTGQKHRDIGVAGAFSIGIGGIVGGGIFATLGLAAVACLGALGVMLVQILGQLQHAHAVWLIVGVAVVPFVYEFLYSAIGARDEAGHGA